MRVVDLFAGCGGMSLGFQNAHYDIVAAYDFWTPAVKVYKDNFTSHSIYQMDLSDTDAAIRHIQAFTPEMIIGGPPCQDFSHAGKRQEGQRASLTEVFATIVTTMKPEWFIMENVDRAQQSNAYGNARKMFMDSGYGLTEYVYNASLCGVPQKRKRFICVGHFGDANGFLDAIIAKNEAKKPMTMRDYFGDSLGIDYYYRHPRNYSRRGFFSIDEPSPTIRGVNRPVPNGYVRHPNDPENIEGLRPLTIMERAQIQTFPKDFKFNGSKTDMEQIIGNAVPVKLAEFVANCVKDYINQNADTCLQHLRNWLVEEKKLTVASAKDVVSRINRASRLTTISINDTVTDVLYRLSKCDDFHNIAPSVKSQLKRAITLYLELVARRSKETS